MRTCLLLSVILMISHNAVSMDRENERPESSLTAGPGLLIVDKPHRGGDTRVIPIPAVYYQQGRFSLFGPKANWVFYHEDNLTLSVLAQLRDEGYKPGESASLTGMSRRRATLEAGIAARRAFDWGHLTAEWTSDVLNEHKGHELRLTGGRRFTNVFGIEHFSLTPAVGGNWRSKQLNNYYYGVRPNEAAPGRRAYNAGDAINLLTTLQAGYKVSERWNVFASVSVEWLNSEITDSPIVDQHHRTSILFGAMYTF